MMKKKIKESILKAIGKAVEVETNVLQKDWPPYCNGILHQPKRPKKKIK